MMMMGTTTCNVFTAAQWEELEQQALIYKYMVSGVPVPTELILSVRRSLFHSSSSSLNQPTLGVWEGSLGYNQLYQMGGGGRKVDLEPGRCRRTDGKKWRCSKEAYPDSKYCERHMHRGRNRSRKPVEFSSSSSSSSSSSITPLTISKPISASDTYPLFSSNVNHGNFVDSSSCYKDYRYLQGTNDLYTTQKMSSLSSCSSDQFNFQNLNNKLKDEEAERQHCFVMGTDFIKSSEDEEASKSTTNRIVIKNNETLTTHKQPFHHFFSATNDPAWVEVDQHQNLINQPKSPLSTQDLFQSKPRPYW